MIMKFLDHIALFIISIFIGSTSIYLIVEHLFQNN